jgi:hypothetical protein
MWESLPDPVPRQALDALAQGREYEDFCIDLPTVVEMILSQFRSMELEMRHLQWASALFTSVDEESTGQMSFHGFQKIFSRVQPVYTNREIAQMFSNLVRISGTPAISLKVFKKLVHQMMSSGVAFSAATHSGKCSNNAVIE